MKNKYLIYVMCNVNNITSILKESFPLNKLSYLGKIMIPYYI